MVEFNRDYTMPSSEQEEKILQARVQNARDTLEQAKVDFGNAADSERTVWQGRIDQRQKALDKALQELEEFQSSRMAGAV